MLRAERGSKGAVPGGPTLGRRLQGALAAAPGGDNRAGRRSQPEWEPERCGADLGLSGTR